LKLVGAPGYRNQGSLQDYCVLDNAFIDVKLRLQMWDRHLRNGLAVLLNSGGAQSFFFLVLLLSCEVDLLSMGSRLSL
jgi:hypothetical protein